MSSDLSRLASLTRELSLVVDRIAADAPSADTLRRHFVNNHELYDPREIFPRSMRTESYERALNTWFDEKCKAHERMWKTLLVSMSDAEVGRLYHHLSTYDREAVQDAVAHPPQMLTAMPPSLVGMPGSPQQTTVTLPSMMASSMMASSGFTLPPLPKSL